MSRKLQPVQVVTYPKKIIYKKPENEPKNFFDTFAGLFLINILVVLASITTSGIGSSIAIGLEASQLSQAIISTSLQTLINFSINTTFDAIRGQATTENLLLNALFAITDIGKIGRGLKEDKLIKLLNQSDLLSQFGFNEEIKNFYQLQQFLKMKDVLLKDKTKIIFKKTVTDSELLQSIFLVADSELKQGLKSLSYDQLKTFVDIEKAIYVINPRLITNNASLNLKQVDIALRGELGIRFNDFLRLDDTEAVNALFKLQTSKIGEKTLTELNLIRMQSKFQRSLYQVFKENWKNLKNKAKKLNPIYWANKFVNNITENVENGLKEIRNKSLKFLPKINQIGQKLVKENNLIPCQAKSFLLAFNFEPIAIDGSGYITIYKKPYVWKKGAKISSYNPVRIWTNLDEVKRFVAAPNQSKFYNENWALGYGFRQAKLENIVLISSGLGRVYRQIQKFNKQINRVKIILESGIFAYAKTITERKTKRFINSRINSSLAKFISVIPSGSIFTSSIIKSIRSGKWNYSWIQNDIGRFSTNKIVQKAIGVKNARNI